jgi:signal transduction histidine kinase
VLKVYAPIHKAASAEIIAAAELYFSAASLTDLQSRAQVDIWMLVAAVGAAVVTTLYLLVSRASRTIALQRARLAENLDNSRRLASENRALHAASEELRLTANSANEKLLAQVGSDIHDGPIQLLSLIILRLTGHRGKAGPRKADLDQTVAFATEAMEDLRNISNGLVLPELTDADLNEALALAISRHENLTGSVVKSDVEPLPKTASSAVKACAYRIIQEGLNNAFRHGEGNEQAVSARCEGEVLVIEVTNPADPNDAGAGLRTERNSLGLHGMRFRVESVGGNLQLDIGNGPLARIVATIPLEPTGRR